MEKNNLQECFISLISLKYREIFTCTCTVGVEALGRDVEYTYLLAGHDVLFTLGRCQQPFSDGLPVADISSTE